MGQEAHYRAMVARRGMWTSANSPRYQTRNSQLVNQSRCLGPWCMRNSQKVNSIREWRRQARRAPRVNGADAPSRWMILQRPGQSAAEPRAKSGGSTYFSSAQTALTTKLRGTDQLRLASAHSVIGRGTMVQFTPAYGELTVGREPVEFAEEELGITSHPGG